MKNYTRERDASGYDVFIIETDGGCRIERGVKLLDFNTLQGWVGGSIEGISFPVLGCRGYVNADGHLDGSSANVVASELWHHLNWGRIPDSMLHGTVVILTAGDGDECSEADLLLGLARFICRYGPRWREALAAAATE